MSAQSAPLNFNHLSFKEGLIQSPISAIFQDDKGFVWIGNWKGLTRYNGYEFYTFKHKDTDVHSLSNNRVNAICQDANKRLWIATSNGLNRYDPQTEVFEHINIIKSIKGGRNYISSVIEDSNRNLWVATFGGVKRVDTLAHELRDVNAFKQSGDEDIASGITFTLYQDHSSTVWVGTRNGVKRFNPKTGKVLPLPASITGNAALMAAKVLVIRQDKYENIWFGTETSGLFCYDAKTGNCISYQHNDNDPKSLQSDWIKAILVRNDNTIWVGTRRGLSIFNQSQNRFENYTHNPTDNNSLNDNTIWSFLQDNANGVWIGTFAGGINIYYPGNNNFSNIGERVSGEMGLNHPVVNAVLEDSDRKLWIGTYGGGINLLNRETGTSQYFSVKSNRQGNSSNGVKSIAEDDKGNLWIGTLDGLCKFNKETKAVSYYKFAIQEGKLSENLINYVLPDTNGVWAGTNGGGLQFLKYTGGYITLKHDASDPRSLSDNFVTALIKDVKDNLWIGTQNGLNYYDKALKQITACYKRSGKYPLSHATILNLFYDSKQRLWVGTEGGALNCFDEHSKRFYTIDQSLGIHDEVIHTIVEDSAGKIWVSTDNGLFRIYFKDGKFPFTKANTEVTQYTANDGLASNQFLTNSGTKIKSGELLFGGINGLTIFNPNQLLKNSYRPPVVLTGLAIKNKPVAINTANSPLRQSITQSRRITLSYDQGYISLDFAALNYNNPENNQYAYRMQGLSNGEGWHYVGHQHTASYTNLEPGHYTFEVKAANNDGVWNNNPTTLSITVLPPFWRTWWAYLFYVLSFASVLYVIIRFFRIRAKLERDLYHEHLHNERQQELYQLKLNFFTNISHEIRTPLTLILGPLEKLMDATRENLNVYRQLGNVKNNADRLMRLVTELLDFRKAEAGHLKLYYAENDIVKFVEEIFVSFQNLALSKNITYNFQSVEAPEFIYFDRDQLEKVFFNLLSNAFKFTPNGGCINVVISNSEDAVSVSIKDNGKGISENMQGKLFEDFFQVEDPQAHHIGTGIGLALSKNIIELHKGTIKVHSKPSINGQPGETEFAVSLQKGTAHLEPNRIVAHDAGGEEASHYYIHSQVDHIIDDNAAPVTHTPGNTILVVEDNEEVRQFITQSLEEHYRIIQSENGVAGLSAVLEQLPDLIITDVMMPEMDGMELCRHIKTDERLNHIPVVMLTARANLIHQLSGFEHGADAYITKPFSLQMLLLQVGNILASKLAIRQKFSREYLMQPQKSNLLSPDEKFLGKLMSLIEKHMDNSEFGVTELIDEIGMSKNVLYKKVQALTNLSVADFIKSIRLQKAAQLLESNKLSIAEVAFAVGFNDRKYFSKEFKKQYNLSPSEYLSNKGEVPMN
ncbi:hybrid sensor histidine kinase/response regulator [Mucilaginibacter galii]|uniref:histidine kinase n=1 Tax=Mucilaginibacter galii TaxID=2005073 RepID=A0A917JBK7_9SPHI|nr:hybrid sensor histidine kinase/response regulator transcription factor [Mucilaginibacter galii]GGI50729.1 hybrid sensor histidine kinase/response regulator [Mucilaginibacter galii]